jgi:glycosyltransferase involved in cell wall biosynthesis
MVRTLWHHETEAFGKSPFVSISNNQRAPLPDLMWAATIYHGLPDSLLTYRAATGGYLAFLGRLAPEKGPDTAIRVAKAAKMPLRIAAKIPRGETRYFRETIKPLVDGHEVQFVGEVNDKQKNDFLGNATALVFPMDWPEPFGLVMIEAKACGTPVIAWRRGSVAEIVEDGVTGFVVDNEAEAVSAVGKLATFDRACVRAAVPANRQRRQNSELRPLDANDSVRPLVRHPGARRSIVR